VSADDVAEGGNIDRLLFQELIDAQMVSWPAYSQSGCDDVFRAQHAGFHRAFVWMDFKVDFIGLCERLRIEVVRHRDKLDRPAFDKNAFFSKVGITE